MATRRHHGNVPSKKKKYTSEESPSNTREPGRVLFLSPWFFFEGRGVFSFLFCSLLFLFLFSLDDHLARMLSLVSGKNVFTQVPFLFFLFSRR